MTFFPQKKNHVQREFIETKKCKMIAETWSSGEKLLAVWMLVWFYKV